MMSDTDKTISTSDLEPEATQIVTQTAAETTQMAAKVECPVCHSPNPPSETYCVDCGFLLSSEPEEIIEVSQAEQVGVLVTQDGTREFALHPGENTVGRQDSDILLTHNTVSRKHAIITIDDGRVYIEDVGSTNGTFVNGHKLEPGERLELTDDAEVVFGNQVLIFRSARKEPAEQSASTEQEPVEAAGEVVETDTPETAQLPPVARITSADGTVRLDLKPGTYYIGRRESNDIVIPNPYCSGRHAELTVSESGFTIKDLTSTNGTLVNGIRIEPNTPKEIQIFDEITVGQTVLKLEAIQ
ncbi:MAG: FHA domain-containing protein [Armatimonadota bacterium]